MIYPGPLNHAQRAKTQKNYCLFNLVNGASYMCLGETLIVLFAIKLNAPNGMVAALSATIYFAFCMLPLGKLVAARVGAARSQAVFWTWRNIVAVGVASSAVTAYVGYPTLALVQIFIGACLFYGLRAAGVVMAQPFIGDMANEQERPHLLGMSYALFYVGSVCTLLLICLVLNWSESVWVITGIIVFGAVLGVSSTWFIRQMDESPAMIRAARKPIMPGIRQVWQIAAVRKLLFAMFAATLSLISIGAVSMLSVKRGYGISDTAALFFSLVQFASSGAVSYFLSRLIKRFGERKTICWSFSLMLSVAVMWIFAPVKVNYLYCVLIFFCVGSAFVICSSALTAYYLQVTPVELRVAGSMLTTVVTSVLAGLAGMLWAAVVFKILDNIGADWLPLNCFKVYFFITLLVLLIGARWVWILPEKSDKSAK